MPQNVRFFDRSKFVWDGELYDARATADARKSQYETQEFQTRLIEEEGKFLLYTRRVVKNVVVEGEPPPV